MRYFMRFSKFGRVTALAALTLVTSAAVWARPVITGPGTVAVGANVVFTISDDAPADGFSVTFNSYLADFTFSFNPAYLQFAHADAVLGGSFLIGPTGPADITTPGEFGAQLIGPNAVIPAANQALFTLTFTALASTGASSTIVNMSLPDGGTYGDGGSFVKTSGIAAITSAVPEPQSLALLAIGGVAMLGARRRRTHQQQHQQQHQQS